MVYWLLSGIIAACFSFRVCQPGLCHGTAIRKARLDSQLFSCSGVHAIREAAVQSSSAAGRHRKPHDKGSGPRKLPSGRADVRDLVVAAGQRCSVPIRPRTHSRSAWLGSFVELGCLAASGQSIVDACPGGRPLFVLTCDTCAFAARGDNRRTWFYRRLKVTGGEAV